MRPHPLVRPLEPEWQARLDALARARGWPESADPRLATGVIALSAAYNRDGRAPARLDATLQAARLGFFFARDVTKGAAGLRELLDHGAIGIPEGRPLRILDLGAGLGATTIGAARAIRAAGHDGPIEAMLVDREPTGLDLAAKLAEGVPGLTVTTRVGDAREADGRFDLVLLGQVLCELDPERPDRDAIHAAWIADLLDRRLTEEGSLVIVEPALRDGTRHLHRVRDRLAARVYAPCLHAGACPMLAREADWCHEHVDVGLPEWLVPVARAAGLRWEGLTFAYLVLRRDGRRRPGRLRVVSEPLVSKGRSDRWVCGELPEGPGRMRLGRLDRHASDANAAWDALSRGDIVDVDPLEPRIGPATRVS
jgi:ribosomal protein RSM22 (predicted rRNA methylase)